QSIEPPPYRRRRFGHLRDPEFHSLAGRNIRLLCGTEIANRSFNFGGGLVESPSIVNASSCLRFAGPYKVGRHAAGGDDHCRERPAHRQTLHAVSGAMTCETLL